jgi:hypothetical protein
MKKIAIHLLIVMNYANMMQAENEVEQGYQSYSDVYKPANQIFTPDKKSKKKPVKMINFTPELAFGGDQATGTYNPKKQLAMIHDTNQIYKFIKITQQRTNATMPDKKNLDPNLTLIGSFSTKTNHAGMPVTMYLFGVSENKLTPNPLNPEIKNNLPGSNPATYAPRVFLPAHQFASDGLVGNYFASSHVATIHDPSGSNQQSYTFENVQEGGITAPDGLVLLGSYTSRPACSGNICSHAIALVNLYGTLQAKEQTSDIPVQ